MANSTTVKKDIVLFVACLATIMLCDLMFVLSTDALSSPQPIVGTAFALRARELAQGLGPFYARSLIVICTAILMLLLTSWTQIVSRVVLWAVIVLAVSLGFPGRGWHTMLLIMAVSSAVSLVAGMFISHEEGIGREGPAAIFLLFVGIVFSYLRAPWVLGAAFVVALIFFFTNRKDGQFDEKAIVDGPKFSDRSAGRIPEALSRDRPVFHRPASAAAP